MIRKKSKKITILFKILLCLNCISLLISTVSINLLFSTVGGEKLIQQVSSIIEFDTGDENFKISEDILLFQQKIGSITRNCAKKDLFRQTHVIENGHNCWLPTTTNGHRKYRTNRSVNGPMPIHVRTWMKELNSALEAYSELVFISSHRHQGREINHLQIVGFNVQNEIWENANVTMSFPSNNPCRSLHSPSVAVDDANKILYMYIHGHKCKQKPSLKKVFQPTLLLKSFNAGISWELSSTLDDLVKPPYLLWDLFYLSVPRYSKEDGYFYAIAKTQENPEGSSILCRSKHLNGPFEYGPLLSKGIRHADLHIIYRRNEDNALRTYFLVFFTIIGDTGEKVVLGNIDVSAGNKDWMDWQLLPGPILLRPKYWYEHGGVPAKPSEPGPAQTSLCELRDPRFLRKEEGEMINTNLISGTLFYSVQGEQAIATAEILIDLKAYFEDSLISYRDYSNIRSDVLASTSFEEQKQSKKGSLLITGVGRSGTTSLCVLFQSMGINISHDNDDDCGPYPGPDGAVSWYDAFKDMKGRRYSNFVHLTRDPLEVINSRAQKAMHQSDFLIKILGTYEDSTDLSKQKISLTDSYKFSLKHWVRRNSFVESYASWRTQIELISNDPFSVWQLCLAGKFGYRCPSLTDIQQKLSTLPSDLNSNYANTTKSTFQIIKNIPVIQNRTKLTWTSLQEIVGLENRKYIKIAQAMGRRYGYTDLSMEDSGDQISYFCQFTERQNNVGCKWDCFLSNQSK